MAALGGRSDWTESRIAVVSVFVNDGTGRFSAPIGYATGGRPKFVVAGDLNGDGRPDLAVSSSYEVVTVLLNRPR